MSGRREVAQTVSPLSVRWWDERLYPKPESRDPFLSLNSMLDHHIREHHRVLDIGAGAGENNCYQLKGRCREIVGVDVDPRVVDNPLLDRGVTADASGLPFDDATFDVAFSVYVLEHVENPGSFVREVGRVLKPGGLFLALTPNKYHYVSALSSLTPTSFHKWYNKKRGREEDDTFPTFYRMNSRSSLHRVFCENGFTPEAEQLIEVRPNYLTFSVPTFLLGAAYERLVNGVNALASLRVNLVVAYRKSQS